MNDYLRRKLNILSFILIIMVVFIHADFTILKIKTGTITLDKGMSFFIQYFISNGITRIAVPLFFIISSYLFFVNTAFTISIYIYKIKKRFKTLVIPYLFWSFSGILLFAVLQAIPYSQNYFTKQLIRDYSISDFFSTLLLSPIPYQLWFIRDLVILVIFSPLIYLFITRLWYGYLAIIIALWVLNVNVWVVSSESILSFSLGSYISINRKVIKSFKQPINAVFLFGLWIVGLIIESVLNLGIIGATREILNIVHKILIVLGVPAIWFFYDVIYKKYGKTVNKMERLTPFTFIIYLLHEPYMTIAKKILVKYSVNNDVLTIGIYLLLPTITIFFCIIIGKYLKTNHPNMLSIVTGGRF